MGRLRAWWKSPRVRHARRRVSDLQDSLLHPLVRAVALLWARALSRRVQWTESGSLPEIMQRGEPAIICAWHQDILPSMGYLILEGVYRRGYRVALFVGPGRAGSLGGAAVEGCGLYVAKPVKHQRGARVEAVRVLAEYCTQHRTAAVLTGDGSRGPAFEARWGAVYLARDTGFPLMPLRTVFSHSLELQRTWARFRLPPIVARGRAHGASGEPLYVPPDADKATLDACRVELERRMNALIPVADARLAGETAIPTSHHTQQT